MIKDILKANENITPNSKNMEVLHTHFPQCFNNEGKFDMAKFQTIISENVDVTHEGYSLDFLGKGYAKLLASTDTTTIIQPDLEHNSLPENVKSENIYISGDNLDGLKHLLKSYARKVKCIYIDPPYNTGSDGFVYNDNFKFTVEDLETKLSISQSQAEKILDLTKRGSASHSAWLMFMAARLQLARDLLTDDGVIFISIDDNEQANLKLLCDNIFGEENFVTQFIRKGSGGRQDSEHYAIVHEYILCIAKNIKDYKSGEIIKEGERFPHFDAEANNYYKTQLLRKWGENSKRSDRPKLFYSIIAPDGSENFPMLSDAEEGCWRWGRETMNKAILDGKIEFKKKDEVWVAYEKIFKPQNDDENTKLHTTIIDNIGVSTGAKLIKNLFGDKVFNYPKPVDLIKFVIGLVAENNGIILDFFSGSSTTAHAVMQLNAEYNDNRRYIMVQLPESTKEKSVARKMGYNTIDQIGIERIKRAAKKIKVETGADIDYGFKHYTLAEPSDDAIDKMEEFDPNAIFLDEQNTLNEFGAETVLETWLVRDGYGFGAEVEEVMLDTYKAYHKEKHLYLLEEEFTDRAMVGLMNKYASTPSFNPENIVVFGYSFGYSELDMLKSNIRSLAKNINLDIRY